MATLSRNICCLQAGRTCAYYRNILLYLRLADATLRETAFTAGDGVECAAQRHLSKYALAYAVVAVEALADTVKIALFYLLNKIGLNYPLA